LKKVLDSIGLLLLSLFVCIADQWTKAWAVTHVPVLDAALPYPFGGIGVLDLGDGWSVSLNLIGNTGAAWGIMQDRPTVLLALRIFLLIALVAMIVVRKVPTGWQIPLALVVGGAAGNLWDSFTKGAVVDFLHVQLAGWSFPIFNLADTAITLGILWMLFVSYRNR